MAKNTWYYYAVLLTCPTFVYLPFSASLSKWVCLVNIPILTSVRLPLERLDAPRLPYVRHDVVLICHMATRVARRSLGVLPV